MLKRHEIQTLARAGHSRPEIASLTGASERTIDRVIKEEPVAHLDDAGERRKRKIGRPSKVTPFRERLRKWLEENPTLPTVELLHRLRKAGYKGGKSAVYEAVREIRPKKQKLVTRFEGLPGEFTQHDFGEVRVRYLDGTSEKVIFLATRLKFSRWVEVSLVENQTAETLVRTCCTHYEAIGGVPLLAVFDRPKTVAIAWKKDGTITKYNPLFAQAMFEMGVGVEVCWPYSPQQKGSVENLVGWVKGSFFKCRRFYDKADLLAQLQQWQCEANTQRPCRATGMVPQARMATEQMRLRPLKVVPAELAVRRPVRVGPTAMVSIEGSSYSMPPEAAGFSGTAFLFVGRIRIEAGRYDAEHPRFLTPGQKSVLPAHRAARLSKVSGRRGKAYLKRQDVMEVGDIAVILLDEIVHTRPKTWHAEVDLLHNLLQTYGDGLLSLAMHMAVAARTFSATAVEAHLVTAAITGATP